MKTRGFTLIELLAVIVILAIIALIAVPIILNIINDSKEQSRVRSAELYEKAVLNAIMKKQLDGNTIVPDGTYIVVDDGRVCLDGDKQKTCLPVEVEGEIPDKESILYIGEDYTIETSTLYFKTKKVVKAENGDRTISDKESTPDYYYFELGNIRSVSDGLPSGVSKTKPEEKSAYLGFDAKDDKEGTTIDSAYVCFEKKGVTEPYCIKGADGGTAYENNKTILNTAFPKACIDNGGSYHCVNEETGANALGSAYVNDGTWNCYVAGDNTFACFDSK